MKVPQGCSSVVGSCPENNSPNGIWDPATERALDCNCGTECGASFSPALSAGQNCGDQKKPCACVGRCQGVPYKYNEMGIRQNDNLDETDDLVVTKRSHLVNDGYCELSR